MNEGDLDMRIYPDDVEDLLKGQIKDRVRQNLKTRSIILRPEQVAVLLRGTGQTMASTTEKLHSIFGIPVAERPDGLTPRERSVQRALTEFPPTRDEQVAEALAEGVPTAAASRDALDPCLSCGGRNGAHERSCYFV